MTGLSKSGGKTSLPCDGIPAIPMCRRFWTTPASCWTGTTEIFAQWRKSWNLNWSGSIPDSAYDEDGDITEEQVRKHIGLLLSSYPNANPGNEEAYVGMMVGEVLTECPSVIVLESACSQLRRTNKFPPTTAEVIEAIKEQEELWSPRRIAIYSCSSSAWLLREELTAVTELVAAHRLKVEEQRRVREEKKRADDELRAKPLVVGDRVRCTDHHAASGVIVDIWEEDTFHHRGMYVVFDDAVSLFVSDFTKLRRLLPGDSEYRVNEYQARAWRRLAPVVGDRLHDCEHGPGRLMGPPDFQHLMFWADDGGWFEFADAEAMKGRFSRILFGDSGFLAPRDAPEIL